MYTPKESHLQGNISYVDKREMVASYFMLKYLTKIS